MWRLVICDFSGTLTHAAIRQPTEFDFCNYISITELASSKTPWNITMALPLSIFKTPSQISLPISFTSDKGSNGTESKLYLDFGTRRKNSRQSRTFIDTHPAQQTKYEQVCPYL
jgi:hypothetical protein